MNFPILSPARLARSLQCAALALLAAASLASSNPAAAQAELTAIPADFSAGARIRVNITGLALSTNYRLRLEQARPATGEFDLVSFSSGLSTNLAVSATVPEIPSGDYLMVLYRVQLGLTRLVAIPVTVVPGPVVTLTPNQASPGRSVTVSVSNLVTGSIRVLYAGQTILGPVPVGETYIGRFLVPGDRPPSLPATVPVVIENLVGRLVVRRATVDFQALARSTAPRLGFQAPQVPATQLNPRESFNVSGRLLDDAGLPPTGRQQLYFIGGGVTVPVDTSVSLAGNGDLQLEARTPDDFLDGLSTAADRPGNLVMVNQGRDRDTQGNRDGRFTTPGSGPVAVIDGRDASTTTFEIEVRRFQSGGSGPALPGAIIEAAADYQSAFFVGLPPSAPNPDEPPSASDFQAFHSTLPSQLQQVNILNMAIPTASNYGCATTFFRKTTNAQGRAVFTIRPEDIAQTNAIDTIEQFCDNANICRAAGGAGPSGGGLSQISFVMNVYGAHIGHRSIAVAIGYDRDSGQFTDIASGQTFSNNRLVVELEASQDSDFDLRNMRIDGVGPPERRYPPGDCPQSSAGICYHNPARFQSMYTYPDTQRWPSNRFTAFNVGRKVRLSVDTQIYGPVTSGSIRIGNTAPAAFSSSAGTPACVLDATTEVQAGEVEYIATLPDLTRLPAGIVQGTVELRFGSTPTRTFPISLYTSTPPLDVLNPNVATLQIDALADNINGTYNTPGIDIPVSSPGHGIGRLDSKTRNRGDFSLRRSADGGLLNDISNASTNDVAANAGGEKEFAGGFFGFADDAGYSVPATNILFETGIIPLFRYSFGLEPIAAATLGADFWMAATLEFYGQALPQGMNATIDPRLAGGVDLFFDLDALFGLVSGSIRAESELGIAMRSRINQGGLAHLQGNPSPPPGQCFTFDLDGVWEACAVGICAGGRENLVAVREPNACANSVADNIPLMLRREAGLGPIGDPQSTTHFDLTRPRYTASALGGDGRGQTMSVGLRDNGDLIATHFAGGVVRATRVIAVATRAVQHLDVAYYAPDRAMVVWSENTRSTPELASLMQQQQGRAFDDIARTQRLRFSEWDGSRWSEPADLAGVGSVGKPQLAGCVTSPRFVSNGCLSTGEITAVWERDINQNLDSPDIEIWSARWRPDGRGWTSPTRVSEPGISSDMHPSVAYRNGTAIVAWARNPGGAFVDLNRRHIAYRFLDGSAQINATTLGLAVGWIDIGVSAADGVVIAFTRAQDPGGFVGNRQALFAARATTCSGGSCAFLVTEVRDPNQRQIRVERPRVAFDEDDVPLIGFRALAFGPDPQGLQAMPGDLPGMLLGTGELAMIRVHSFAQQRYTAQLVGLSDNGLQHWKPDFLYDEAIGGVLAVSMQAPAPTGLRTPLEIAQMMSPEGSPVAAQASFLSDGGTLRMAMGGPDFEVRRAQLSRSVMRTGDAVSLTMDLVNIGAPFVPATHGSLKVVASLNGPSGSGTPLASFLLSNPQSSNAMRAISLNFTVPEGVASDERQTVFIDIAAADDANSVDGVRDHDRIEVNAMPTPSHLNAVTRVNSPFVNVVWASPNDSRIYGWRIWKLDDEGSWQHLGSTRMPGYMDLLGRIGSEVTYRVASYSANGMESEPSEPVSAVIKLSRTGGVFSDGFE